VSGSEFLAELGFGTHPVNAISPMGTAFAQPDFVGPPADRLGEVWFVEHHWSVPMILASTVRLRAVRPLSHINCVLM
jgi:hypothetical protein